MLILVRLYVSVDLVQMSLLSIPPNSALALEYPPAFHFNLSNFPRRDPEEMDRPVYGNNDSHLKAKVPPVMNPAVIAFQGSSFCRYPLTAQS
jgi:hypothetical protein